MEPRTPSIPVELLLKIMRFALTSEFPLIDPLAPTEPDNWTIEERGRLPQVAFGLLFASKMCYTEGIKILYRENRITFTNVAAARSLARLDEETLQDIRQLTLRITAQYYESAPLDRTSSQLGEMYLPMGYHPETVVNMKIACNPWQKRPPRLDEEVDGISSYADTQVEDFFHALDLTPTRYDALRGHQRELLMLPNLESLRLDMVNFKDDEKAWLPALLIMQHGTWDSLKELLISGVSNKPFVRRHCIRHFNSSPALPGTLLGIRPPTYVQLRGQPMQPLPKRPWMLRICPQFFCQEHNPEPKEPLPPKFVSVPGKRDLDEHRRQKPFCLKTGRPFSRGEDA